MESLSKYKNQIKIDDISLNYYEKGTGRPVIILHGNGSDSTSLKKIFETVSKDFKAIAIDSRAHGFSCDGNKRLTLDLFADDIIKFCNKKSLDKVSIVGYSDGANIALLITKKHKLLIDNMVLICGNYKASALHLWFLIITFLNKLILLPFKYINKKVYKKIALLNIMLSDIGVDKHDLKSISAKTLILYSSVDIIYLKHIYSLHEFIANSSLELVKPSTHTNIITKDDTVKLISKFLNDCN